MFSVLLFFSFPAFRIIRDQMELLPCRDLADRLGVRLNCRGVSDLWIRHLHSSNVLNDDPGQANLFCVKTDQRRRANTGKLDFWAPTHACRGEPVMSVHVLGLRFSLSHVVVD